MMVVESLQAPTGPTAEAAPPTTQSTPPRLANEDPLRTVFLDDVPLLDSPAWSSDDELDNPTYNKRFRHKKHEEIRLRLQQRKQEERERQLQLEKAQRQTSTPLPAAENGAAAAAPPPPAQPTVTPQPQLTSCGAGSQLHSLKRTKTGRGRRSRHPTGSTPAQHRCHPVKKEQSLTAAETGAHTPTKKPTKAPAPAPRAPSQLPEVVPAKQRHTRPLKAEAVTITSPPPPLMAAAKRTSMPSTQASQSPRQAHASVNAPISLSQTQTQTHVIVSPGATPRHAGTSQQTQTPTISLTVPTPRQTTITSQTAAPENSSRVVAHNAPSATTVALSSTEVQPRKVRGSHTPSAMFFVSKIVKGGSVPKHSATMPTPIAVATASPRHADADMTLKRTSPSTAAYSSMSSRDDATSLPAVLNVTLPFAETESSQAEKREKERGGSSTEAEAAVGFVVTLRTEAAPARSATAPPLPPGRLGNAAARSPLLASGEGGVDVFVPVPPPSPPQLSAELVKACCTDGAATTISEATNNYNNSSASTPSPRSSVVALPTFDEEQLNSHRLRSAHGKHLRQSDYYNLNGMPSYFRPMMGGHTPRTDKTGAVDIGWSADKVEAVATAMTTLDTAQIIDDWERSRPFDSQDNYSAGSADNYDYDRNEMEGGTEGGTNANDDDDDSSINSPSRNIHSGSDDDDSNSGSGSWSDVLSDASPDSDLDYVLEYHSTYYGDLLKPTDTPPSRETLSVVDDAEKQLEANPKSTEAAMKADSCADDDGAGEGGGAEVRRGETLVAQLDQVTVAAKQSLHYSPSSTHSSGSSLTREHDFYLDEVHGTVTPPIYSFYNGLQTNGETEKAQKRKKELLFLSHVNFGKDPYALGMEDSVIAMSAPKSNNCIGNAAGTAEATTLPHLQNSNGRRASGAPVGPPQPRRGNSAFITDDADPWAYHQARRESWSSMHKRAPSAAGQNDNFCKRSSSIMSTKYSVLSSNKGLFLQQEGRSTRAPLPHSTTPTTTTTLPQTKPPLQGPKEVLALPLQATLPSPQPQPASVVTPPGSPAAAARAVKPLSLEIFGSQTTNNSKSFDLLSPVARKSTAPPEELAAMKKEKEQQEGEDTALASHSLQELQLQKRQQALFSFAGLQYHPPAALQEKQSTAQAPAPPSKPSKTAPMQPEELRECPVVLPSCRHAAPMEVPPPLPSIGQPSPPSQDELSPPLMKDAADHDRGRPPSFEVELVSGRHLFPVSEDATMDGAHQCDESDGAVSHEVVNRPSPHDVYLPITGVEVDRFRNLVGSAYRPPVGTSSQHLPMGRRRLPDHDLARESTLAETPAEPTAANAGNLPHIPVPPTPLAYVPHGSPAAAVMAEVADDVPSTHTSLRSFAGVTPVTPDMLLRVSCEGSVTSTATTCCSPGHRYRRRHPVSRIDAIVEEAVLLSSCLCPESHFVSPMRVAAHGSGRERDLSHTRPQPASASQRDTAIGSSCAASQPPLSPSTSRLSGADDAEGRVLGRISVCGAASAPSSVVPVGGGGSGFLRTVEAPTTSATDHAAASASQTSEKRQNSSAAMPLAANTAIEITPLSVRALVKRLDAHVSSSSSSSFEGSRVARPQRRPLAVQSPANGATPTMRNNATPINDDGASVNNSRSRNHQASVIESNANNSTLQPNCPASVPQSVPRNLNHNSCSNTANDDSCNSEVNHAPSPSSPMDVHGGAVASTEAPLSLFAPACLAVVPKRLTPSPEHDFTRRNGHPPSHATTPSTVKRAARQENFTSYLNTSHDSIVDEPNMPTERVVPPPSSQPSVPGLTMEALMRQQVLQEERKHAILQDRRLLHPPQQFDTRPTANTARELTRSRGRGRNDAGGCHTTEDLLTRITVRDDTRGWRGKPDSSIVSTLDAPLSAHQLSRFPNV